MDEIKNDVKQAPESSPEAPETTVESVKPEEVEQQGEVQLQPTEQPAPQMVPYDRFREVNEAKKVLEDELSKFKNAPSPSEQPEESPEWEMMTDSEKWLAKRVIRLEEEKKWEADLGKVKKIYSELGEKEAEFKTFCYKYPKSVEIETLAKAFLFDGKKSSAPVSAEPKPAIGLEKPTAGPKQVENIEPSLEDIKRLRETQPRLYEKMIVEGKMPKKVPEK
jgi:hypothetical protein